MVLNMGPQHPSTHGVLRVVLELDGETVVKARSEIGYLHTGIEKSCEALTYSQAITLTDRIDYLAPLSNNLGYCLAVEKLLGIEVPKRAQYIRVLLTELTRIASHLVWLGTHAMDLGAMSVMLYCFREREEILKHFRDGLRPADDDQLFPHRRPGAGAAAGLAGPGQPLRRHASLAHRRIRGAADPQPHLADCARRASECSKPRTPSRWASPGPCCAPRAWPTTCANSSLIRATRNSISTCRRAPSPTAMRAIWCAWRRCARA